MDLIDHSVIAHTYPILQLESHKFNASCGPWMGSKLIDGRSDPFRSLGRNFSEIFFDAFGIFNLVGCYLEPISF
jgi:hypothetical protein